MLPKTVSTDDLRSLTGLSKSGVTTFEQQGVIKRSAVNTWPMPDTLVALVTHLRARKPSSSDGRVAWEAARARREEMRAKKEAGELIPQGVVDTLLQTSFGLTTAAYDAAATRAHPGDRAGQRRAQDENKIAAACVSEAFRKLAETPDVDPVSLLPGDLAPIRARLFPGRNIP
jgi:hypothetical protein